jgi:hypothetical protein
MGRSVYYLPHTTMDCVKAIRDYITKMVSEPPGMKVLLLDKDTVSAAAREGQQLPVMSGKGAERETAPHSGLRSAFGAPRDAEGAAWSTGLTPALADGHYQPGVLADRDPAEGGLPH